MGAKVAVGQASGTVNGAGAVGSRENVGAAGTKVAVSGAVGTKVGVNVGVTVGVTVGVKVGKNVVNVGATVGVKVGHNIAPGKVVPVKGSVGVTVGNKVAVGQSGSPPTVVVGKVVAKGRVGAARVVNPGASVVAVGNVVNGGKITAKPCDD
ncbi:MAG: hypothetical protein ACMUHX_03485, partial [bacterium]